jgi:acetoin utilization deacetylase AcuC-like enzyme
VHHGNGTQQAFYGDPDVLYVSCHQYPFFPGSGAPWEVGEGAGAGATVNVALPAGCGDADYEAVFDEVMLPEISRFRPDLVISSVGFDGFVDDPLAGMRVSSEGYRRLARRLCDLAEEVCGGRLVCVLEGGYHLRGLADGMVAVLDAMDPVASAGVAGPESRSRRPGSAAPGPAARAAIDATKTALRAARGGA